MARPKKRRLDTDVSVMMIPSEAVQEEKEKFWGKFKSLFNSPEDSDVTLYIGSERLPFHGHSLILNMRTDYFKETTNFKDGSKCRIYFGIGESVHRLWRMLQYIYTGDYDSRLDIASIYKGICPKISPDIDFGLDVHTYVYQAADKYKVTGLKDLCVEKFQRDLVSKWHVNSFCHAVPAIFGGVSLNGDHDKMRNVILEATIEHARELRKMGRFRDILLDEYAPGFARALVLKMFSD